MPLGDDRHPDARMSGIIAATHEAHVVPVVRQGRDRGRDQCDHHARVNTAEAVIDGERATSDREGAMPGVRTSAPPADIHRVRHLLDTAAAPGDGGILVYISGGGNRRGGCQPASSPRRAAMSTMRFTAARTDSPGAMSGCTGLSGTKTRRSNSVPISARTQAAR